MTTEQSMNETALEQRNGARSAGVDLASAGRGIMAAADASPAVAWAQKYAVVYHVVDQIVDTPMFPSDFWPMPVGVKPWDFRTPWLKHPTESLEDYVQRRRIAAAGGTTTALWGEGYGWSPPQSWRLIYVANGKASLYAEGVLALLRGAGIDVEKIERSETRAAVRMRRPGKTAWQEYEFTWEDAVRAGYVKHQGPNKGKDKGGNEKYDLDPKGMLWARVITTGGRIEAPDVLAGMPVAELIDDDPIEPARGVTVTATAASGEPVAAGGASDRLRDAIGKAPQAEAAAEPTPPPAEHEPVAEDAPSAEQWKAINDRFTELGVIGRRRDVRRLAIISRMVGREVTKGSQLTGAEAAMVLDSLAGEAGARVVGEAEAAADDATAPAPAAEDAVTQVQPDVEDPPQPDPWGINKSEGGDQ